MRQHEQRRERHPPEQERKQLLLPVGYLQEGYFDKDGHILPEVIEKWPMELAQIFLRGGLTSTQLRRFFNRARAIEQQDLPFERLREEILGLKPIVAASVGRGVAPDVFKVFIDKNVDQATRSQTNFSRGFLTHFQSVVAYLKYYEKMFQKGGSR